MFRRPLGNPGATVLRRSGEPGSVRRGWVREWLPELIFVALSSAVGIWAGGRWLVGWGMATGSWFSFQLPAAVKVSARAPRCTLDFVFSLQDGGGPVTWPVAGPPRPGRWRSGLGRPVRSNDPTSRVRRRRSTGR